MNMSDLITSVADFVDLDAIQTKAELQAAKRRRAATQEAFRDLRAQIDIFEHRILEDYDATIGEAEKRLARIEAPPVPSDSNVVNIAAE